MLDSSGLLKIVPPLLGQPGFVLSALFLEDALSCFAGFPDGGVLALGLTGHGFPFCQSSGLAVSPHA